MAGMLAGPSGPSGPVQMEDEVMQELHGDPEWTKWTLKWTKWTHNKLDKWTSEDELMKSYRNYMLIDSQMEQVDQEES